VRLAAAALAVLALAGCGAAPRATVPRSARFRDLPDAYALLRAQGFRVAVARPVAVTSLETPFVTLLSPGAGTSAPRGSTVTIETSSGGPIGSPTFERGLRVRVPSFAGKPASVAVAWADAHRMYWAIPHLPPLAGSTAPSLFAAYRVTAQAPRPGAALAEGVMVGRGFRPTPLTLTVVPRG